MLYRQKVLLCNNGSEGIGVEALSSQGFEVITCLKDGAVVLETIEATNPDAVVMSIFMPTMDAIAVMEKVHSKIMKKPIFIITTSHDNPIIYSEAINKGASYIMVEPYDYETLAQRITVLLKADSKVVKKSENVLLIITDILHKIGIPAHIKGYKYLREAISLTIDNPDDYSSVTKTLYPTIAKTFDTTPARVERAIRHAIEIAWNRGEATTISEYFGCTISNTRGKPTNSEFIAIISDTLLLDKNSKIII